MTIVFDGRRMLLKVLCFGHFPTFIFHIVLNLVFTKVLSSGEGGCGKISSFLEKLLFFDDGVYMEDILDQQKPHYGRALDKKGINTDLNV